VGARVEPTPGGFERSRYRPDMTTRLVVGQVVGVPIGDLVVAATVVLLRENKLTAAPATGRPWGSFTEPLTDGASPAIATAKAEA